MKAAGKTMKRLMLALAVFAATSASAAVVPTVDSPVSPDLVLPWFNGAITNAGTNIACLTDPPIVEIRVQGYAGFSYLPPNLTPAVGEVFYTHLVMSHPGNPCVGSAISLELILPPGVQTAVSAADPVFCFARLPNGPRLIDLGTDIDYGCPQTFSQGLEGLRFAAPRGGVGAGLWGAARGFFQEFLVPLRATSPQNGTGQIRWRINPDVGVVAYASVGPQVNGDVLFRTSNENNLLTLDICTVTPVAQGC